MREYYTQVESEIGGIPEWAFDVVTKRRSFALQSIVEVKLEIEERHELGRAQERALEESVLDLRTQLRELESLPWSLDRKRAELSLQKLVIESERSRAQSAIDTWKDVTNIKQSLRALLREYWGTPQP